MFRGSSARKNWRRKERTLSAQLQFSTSKRSALRRVAALIISAHTRRWIDNRYTDLWLNLRVTDTLIISVTEDPRHLASWFGVTCRASAHSQPLHLDGGYWSLPCDAVASSRGVKITLSVLCRLRPVHYAVLKSGKRK